MFKGKKSNQKIMMLDVMRKCPCDYFMCTYVETTWSHLENLVFYQP